MRTLISLNVKNGKKDVAIAHKKKKSIRVHFLKDNSKRNYKRKKELFTSVIDKLSIVTPSEWLKEIVEQSFLEANIKVINNGINLEIFKYSNNTKVLNKIL